MKSVLKIHELLTEDLEAQHHIPANILLETPHVELCEGLYSEDDSVRNLLFRGANLVTIDESHDLYPKIQASLAANHDHYFVAFVQRLNSDHEFKEGSHGYSILEAEDSFSLRRLGSTLEYDTQMRDTWGHLLRDLKKHVYADEFGRVVRNTGPSTWIFLPEWERIESLLQQQSKCFQ